MHVLSLDASSKVTGYCIMDSSKVILESGVIDVSKASDDCAWRIIKLYDRLTEILANNDKIEHIIFEDLSHYYSRSTSALIALSYVHMMLELFCYLNKIEYTFVKVYNWRKTVGITEKKRDLQKKQALQLVKERYGIECSADDEAEAVLIGEWYLDNKDKMFQTS